jgi:glycosyltransferase involved in cell wall biosynthesis
MKRIAIIYPWEDPSALGQGSALRVGLLAKYLKTQFEEVRLLSIGKECCDFDGVESISYWPTPKAASLNTLFSLPYRIALYILTLGKNKGRTFHLQQYKRFGHDRAFNALLRRTVAWADILLVEYPFFAKRVVGMARRIGKRVIVTDHDVLFMNRENAAAGRLVYRAVRRKELSALRSADLVVSVCDEDRRTFLANGVESVCIPHGISVRPVQEGSIDESVASEFARLNGLPFGDRPLCSFVGSGIFPNMEAADAIERLSAEVSRSWPSSDSERPFFIVAGRCKGKVRGDGFSSLGFLSDSDLSALYAISSLIIIPLASGTGASLKTIEAMARGKVVVGTRVAFRGYPVTDGVDCIVEDSISRFPMRIAEALRDKDRLGSISSAAVRFAEGYDYRKVYAAYRDLIVGGEART